MSNPIKVQMHPDGSAHVVEPGRGGPSQSWRDPSQPNVQAGVKTVHRVTFGADGAASSQWLGPVRAYSEVRDPNMVTVGGIETTRQIAEAMGAQIDGEPPRGWRSIPDHVGEATTGFRPTPVAPQNHDPQTVEKFEQDPNQFVPETTKDINDAKHVMADLDRMHGADNVSGWISHVASTGSLPDNLPVGIKQEQIDAIAGAYTDMAEQMIAGTGATLDDITDQFDAIELGYIRGLVIQGKRADVRAVAQIALRRKQAAARK